MEWIGKKYGKLIVVGDIKLPKGLCECECGVRKMVNLYDLRRGKIISCGCTKRERIIEYNTTHNLRGHRLYSIWASMKSRCYNTNIEFYTYYGDKGVGIYEPWLENFDTFYNWAIENGYSDELTIDRIDNDGNYEPSNCRWVTMKEQSRNRSSNKMIEINGKIKPLIEWCEEYDINYKTVQSRIYRGWEIEMALSEKVNGGGV